MSLIQRSDASVGLHSSVSHLSNILVKRSQVDQLVNSWVPADHRHNESAVKEPISTLNVRSYAGIGAAKESSHLLDRTATMLKKKVQNKRQKTEDSANSQEDQFSDAEETESRTSFQRKARTSATDTLLSTIQKKKRKRNKLRRKTDPEQDVEHQDSSVNAKVGSPIQAESSEQQSNAQVPDSTQSKERRRKTRSRQKNIKKDHRPAENKPNYLKLTPTTIAMLTSSTEQSNSQ